MRLGILGAVAAGDVLDDEGEGGRNFFCEIKYRDLKKGGFWLVGRVPPAPRLTVVLEVVGL